MWIVFAVCLFVYVLYKIFRDHLIIFHGVYFLSRGKNKFLKEVTIHRSDLTALLQNLANKPLSQKEINEWIRIARFSDELYFSALPKEFRHFPKLEDLAINLLEPESLQRP